MSRTSRAAVGGVVYHVLNRGNGRMGIFRKPGDFRAYARARAADRFTYFIEEAIGYVLSPAMRSHARECFAAALKPIG